MDQELQAMTENNTWSVVPLLEGKKAIGCKWIYTNKLNSDGSLARHKARLMAKGYNQKGVDFIDFFSGGKVGHCETSFGTSSILELDLSSA